MSVDGASTTLVMDPAMSAFEKPEKQFL